MQIDSILAVCTGNICRSPLAEGLLRRELPDVCVRSAGVAAVVGGRMPEPAARIAEREGLELKDHRGQQITSSLIREFDLVLVMENAQRQWINEQFPQARGRVFLVSHWSDGDDIPDPYRESDDVFETVYRSMAESLEQWRMRLT